MFVSGLCMFLARFMLAEIVMVRGLMVALAGLMRRLCHCNSSLGEICSLTITVAAFCDGVATVT
jgi:hypothetical protein